MSTTKNLLDTMERLQNPVVFLRLRLYIEKWEKENTNSSRDLLDTVNRFCKLVEIADVL